MGQAQIAFYRLRPSLLSNKTARQSWMCREARVSKRAFLLQSRQCDKLCHEESLTFTHCYNEHTLPKKFYIKIRQFSPYLPRSFLVIPFLSLMINQLPTISKKWILMRWSNRLLQTVSNNEWYDEVKVGNKQEEYRSEQLIVLNGLVVKREGHIGRAMTTKMK